MPPPPPPPPLLLFLDFDSTLTTTSTLPLIASIATRTTHPALPSLSQAYARHLSAHDRTYRPARPDRTTIPQELAYLDDLRPVERASVERIEAAGLFRGVRTRDVDVAAARVVGDGQVRLRAGFADLLKCVRRRRRGGGGGGGGGKVAIVSVAWSRRFIYGVLSAWASRCEGGDGGVRVGDVDVRANEIAGDGSGGLDRVFGAEGGVWTAGDKERVMSGVIEAAVGGNSSVPRTIYIGDSPTDLACLIKAEVGICIRDGAMTGEQRELQGTLERVGVECLHVGRFEDEQMEDGGKRLWWARDFEEVCQSGVMGELSE
ncbi:MAG: hypothetical protein Q9161_007828 [Pseudevernia consocians]